jgi:hypothetical protein
MVKRIAIEYPGAPSALEERAIDLFARHVEAHGVRLAADTGGDARLRLGLSNAIAPEGYRIARPGDGVVEVTGGDPSGLLYGIGKLLRGSRFAGGDVDLGRWEGTSVPAKPIRGIYFATHFGNFYEAAPVAAIERYVEELALWGCNALSVWFDMHQYAGLDDTAAQNMVERLRSILKAANGVGIRGALTMLANEGYATSPEPLRADWTAGHDGYTSPPGGHYHREICPSKPGGLDVILATRREMLRAFADLDIAYAWIWPYDQGGCTCSRCAPWGANGFLRTAEPLAGIIRDILPQAKVVLSTWYFDHFTTGEWEGLSRAFANGAPPWVDLLLAGDYGGGFPSHLGRHGVPGNLPVVSFPEISMEDNLPWGGYGTNPRPAVWQDYEQAHGRLLSGGFPYSEGIFEDLNKVLTLQLSWDPDRSADDIVREYAAAEFSPEIADDVVHVVQMMETGLDHGLHASLRELILSDDVRSSEDLRAAQLYRWSDRPYALSTAAAVTRLDRQLTPATRTSWRWRLLWLRAAIDAELQRSGGRSTDFLESWFDELAGLYYANERSLLAVTPPSRKALFDIIKHGRDTDT